MHCKNEGGWLFGANDTDIFNKFNIKSKNSRDFWTGIFMLENEHDQKLYIESNYPKEVSNTLPTILYNSSIDCLYYTFNNDNSPDLKSTNCQQMKPFICQKRKYVNSDLTKNLNVCPQGWYYSFTDAKCFRYYPSKMDYDSAKQTCSGKLAKPQSWISNLAIINVTLIELNDRQCGTNIKCENKGECQFSNNKSSCKCSEEFSGEFCEVENYSGTETKYLNCPLGTFSPKTCQRKCACLDEKPCDETSGACSEFKCKENYYGPNCNKYFEFPNPWIGVECISESLKYVSGEKVPNLGLKASTCTSKEGRMCYTLSDEWRTINTLAWDKKNCSEKRSFVCERDPDLGSKKIVFLLFV